MITSVYDYSQGVLRTTFDSQLQVRDMFSYFKEVERNTTYPRKLKVFLDASTVLFDWSFDELELISNAHKDLLGTYDCIWVAFIVTSPNETAISFLYKQFSELNNLRFSIFSTNETAAEWLEHVF